MYGKYFIHIARRKQAKRQKRDVSYMVSVPTVLSSLSVVRQVSERQLLLSMNGPKSRAALSWYNSLLMCPLFRHFVCACDTFLNSNDCNKQQSYFCTPSILFVQLRVLSASRQCHERTHLMDYLFNLIFSCEKFLSWRVPEVRAFLS